MIKFSSHYAKCDIRIMFSTEINNVISTYVFYRYEKKTYSRNTPLTNIKNFLSNNKFYSLKIKNKKPNINIRDIIKLYKIKILKYKLSIF